MNLKLSFVLHRNFLRLCFTAVSLSLDTYELKINTSCKIFEWSKDYPTGVLEIFYQEIAKYLFAPDNDKIF